ncbi:MAG: type III secretion system ATPase SctN [Gammaproteobacteria bacterium]|nr:type III secretion system ATPase SctN [Gammaproteobacteria bacterium]
MADIPQNLINLQKLVESTKVVEVYGRIKRVVGTLIYASATRVKVGEVCELRNQGEDHVLRAEVVGINDDEVILSPLGEMVGLSTETILIPTGRTLQTPVGEEMLGRVVDGLGHPLDMATMGPMRTRSSAELNRAPPDPMKRKLIDTPFSSGVRVIDGMLTTGYGQRMGIFAAAGGGKSTLMGMLVLGADVDVCVVCLIGERGREVREFIEHNLGPEGMKRSVVVCATSDKPPVERAKSAYTATAIAEYFRDQGKRVLLLMDSVTRFARAQREIGLAAGEPPTRRGFPPSVFAELPRLLERSGQSDKGSITAFYTVLVEGDDMNEPIADEVRSILDGHIVLSKELGSKGHFPAVDVLTSASRVMNQIVPEVQAEAARQVREWMAKYNDVELLIKIGEYQMDSDPVADQAISRIDEINAFLRQDFRKPSEMSETLQRLMELVA